MRVHFCALSNGAKSKVAIWRAINITTPSLLRMQFVVTPHHFAAHNGDVTHPMYFHALKDVEVYSVVVGVLRERERERERESVCVSERESNLSTENEDAHGVPC